MSTQLAAHRHLIRHALQNGWTIQCEDYDDWEAEGKLVKLTTYKAACEYIEAVDGGQDFFLVEPDKDLDCPGTGRLYWVGLAIGYGNLPCETVCDYSVHPFVDAWLTAYMNDYNGEGS
jgi:hypothetical protein